jgi:Tol biopolymer transport system component
MRVKRLLGAALLLPLLGCPDQTPTQFLVDPEIHTDPLPAVEDVPYAAIGGGRIAFHRTWPDGSVGLVVLDGGAQQTHTYLGGTQMIEPSVSPDGTEVAFINNEQSWDIFVAKLDGTDLRRITTYAQLEGPPTWTPEGNWVVAQVESDDLAVVGILRHWPGGVALGELEFATPEREVNTEWEAWHRVAYAPGGGLAFANDAGFSSRGIWTANAPAGTFTVVRGGLGLPLEINLFAPSWSPDVSELSFVETERDPATGEHLETRIRTVAGGDFREVGALTGRSAAPLTDGIEDFSSCWTPDGSTIVFTSPDENADHHVYAVPAAGGAVVQVTSALGVLDASVSCH